MIKKIILFNLFLITVQFGFGQGELSGLVTDMKSGFGIRGAKVYISEMGLEINTDKDGYFLRSGIKPGVFDVIIFAEGYKYVSKSVNIIEGEHTELIVLLESLQVNLNEIELTASVDDVYGQRRLRNVEGVAIYAAKKNEVIEMKNIVANLATNNARQVYKGIAGLNIWENDGSGLQLNIGARGLDPNRTSNFNTRQNGYDISADALGYPESYYTPPTQALERIEIVRGAASLQYGPQFGGLLNFKFKQGGKKPFGFSTENTIGSWGLLSTFNSIGGSKNDWNYYAFYQRKQGNGWRDNSDFSQNTAFASISKSFANKLKLTLEYTHMDYLAQQAGGLMDFEFEQDPRQSKRARNWFEVNWDLAAFLVDVQLSEKTKLNSRNFFLHAGRNALGELGPINRPDPLRERDLIKGTYRNFGNETRLIHRYEVNKRIATVVVGGRYYEGFTTNKQGDASAASDADFTFLNPVDLERSSYEFPSKNLSFFAENLFNLTDKWTLTPGARFEYIKTASDGYFKEQVFSGGQVIFEQTFQDQKNNKRSLLLLGIGMGYKLNPSVELYGNFSQNYRSINFSDLAVANPNLVVDSLLQDEKGFNVDVGVRGTLLDKAIRFDASLFVLNYQNRIGLTEKIIQDPVVVERAVAFRTNIGDARIAGVELFAETALLKLLNRNSDDLSVNVFLNASYLHGVYTSGPTSIVDNEVELIPPVSLKSGLNVRWKNLRMAYQYAYTARHFSDATNAAFVVDATRGSIPSYQVQDLSASFTIHRFQLQAGVNNLADASYFTRRASAYPGPGIIPADRRSVYFSVGYKW